MRRKNRNVYKRIYHEVVRNLSENNHKVVYITLVGSRGFGKYKEDSDFDVKVVYLPNLSSLIGINDTSDQYRVNTMITDDVEGVEYKLDIEFMSLKHFCKLISVSNYTPYEWLLSKCIMTGTVWIEDDIESYRSSVMRSFPRFIEIMSNNLKPIAILYSIKSILNNLSFKEDRDNLVANHLSEIQIMLRLINIVSYYREYGQFTFNLSDVAVYKYDDNGIGKVNIPEYICSSIDSFADKFSSSLFKTYVEKLYGYGLGDMEIMEGDDIYKIVIFVKTTFIEYIEHLIRIVPPTHRPNRVLSSNRVSLLSVNDFYIDFISKELGIKDNLIK